MKNNKVLVVVPPKKIYEKIRYDSNYIIYYDNWTFEYFDDETQKIIITSISDLSVDISNLTFLEQDRKMILSMVPVWDRWLRGSFDTELFRDKALLDMVKIRLFLKKKSVKNAIIYTTVPHHIDMSLLSCCLSVLNIPEYYLYEKLLIGNLYLIVKGSILFTKRTIKSEMLTEYQPNKDIDNFIKYSNLVPTANYITKREWYKTNYYSGLLISITRLIKSFFKVKEHRNVSNNESLRRLLHDFNSQKNFLAYYNSNSSSYSSIINSKKNEKPNIIIAAHYQPEASTIPIGGRYSSHIDIILKLRSIGYSKDIYYKEHPDTQMYIKPILGSTGIGGYRSIKYLECLLSTGVKFLSFESLISKNYLDWIITISGHIAIERSLLGLQTIVAGHPWFEGMPGTISLDSVDLESILLSPNKPSEEISYNTKNFLLNKMRNNCLPNLNDNINNGIRAHLDFIMNILKKSNNEKK
jgi:hypothetical protein